MITLEKIIYEVQSDLNDFSNANYMRMLQWLVRGVSDISINHVSNIEVAYLTANNAGKVDLPADYINYLKIGVCVNGLIQVFGINENLCLRRKEECATDIDYSSKELVIKGDIPFVDHYRDGNYQTGVYGVPGGFRTTYFRIDKKNRKIVLGGDIPLGEIVLEYESSGISLTGKTYIEDDFREVLIALLHHRLKQHAPSNTVSIGEKQQAEALYYFELKKLVRSRNRFTISELMDTIHGSYKQTVKR